MADAGTQGQTYSSAVFALELEGAAAGFLRSVEGGEPFGSVLSGVGSSGTTGKHVGNVSYQSILITFGVGMSSGVYQWISDVLSGKGPHKNGAVVFFDYTGKETGRLEFDNAQLASISFPGADAGSTDTASFALTLQPQVTRTITASTGQAVQGFGAKTASSWLVSNFAFKVSGLETACAHVDTVDALVVQQSVLTGAGGLQLGAVGVPDVVFTVAETYGNAFLDWANDFLVQGNNDQAHERSGSFQYLDQTLKTALFTLTFSNLGILRAYRLRSQVGAAVVARIGVDLYCDQISFSFDPAVVGVVAPSTPAIQKTDTGGSASLTETLANIIAGRYTAEQALLATAKPDSAGTLAIKATPEVVAKRLLQTVRPPSPGPVAPKREDGVALGEKWATDTATIDELKQVAVVNQVAWSALSLNPGHSLISVLRSQALLPDSVNEPIQLERDAFVEGIVAGAYGVWNDAAPHLPLISG